MDKKHGIAAMSLAETFQDRFLIGAAVNPLTLDAQKELLVQHFNSVTAENEMKFEGFTPRRENTLFQRRTDSWTSRERTTWPSEAIR